MDRPKNEDASLDKVEDVSCCGENGVHHLLVDGNHN